MVARATRRLSSRTAGQNVIANTDPEMPKAIMTRTQRTALWGMIHSTWKRREHVVELGGVCSFPGRRLTKPLSPSAAGHALPCGFVEHETSMLGDGPNPGLLTQQSPCLPGTHLSCTLNSKGTSRDRGAAGWKKQGPVGYSVESSTRHSIF